MSAKEQHDRHGDESVDRPQSVWMLPFIGLLSLIWFLVRVVPKPSRAAYPCQRVAAPLASGFVVWLLGLTGSFVAFRQWRELSRRSRTSLAYVCLATAVVVGLVTFMTVPERLALADPPVPNNPVGEAKGIHPGRVAWVHAPEATDWDGPGDGHWWEPEHTDQVVVDEMMSRALQALAGESTDAAAWDAIFRHYNQTHGHGDVGYTPGQKVAIKVNLVWCMDRVGGNVDPATYDMIDDLDYMNTSPQMMLALLRHLVYEAGVAPADISIGDPVCLFANQYFDPLHDEFPDVRYLETRGLFGRTAVVQSDVPFYWSCHPPPAHQDRVLVSFAEADYFINLANLKSHGYAGVTLCAKNYYGWLRRPDATGYYNLHLDLPHIVPATGSYRTLVDLMGHADSGGKAVLYLIDGLYAGSVAGPSPIQWDFPLFNGDWTSSLFASQDPVAIDSVAFDLLQEESLPDQYPEMAGADDYLVEAALADNPPSGTFYDPDHDLDVTRLPSLGVHEHWNNSTDRQYSRNLDPVNGEGIELVFIALPIFSDGFESGDTTQWATTVPVSNR
jgi:hypothetical protein